jgi:hypothetical protein
MTYLHYDFAPQNANQYQTILRLREFCMKTQSMLKTLAVTISLGVFALIGCSPQSTAEAPALEPSVEASVTESSSVISSPLLGRYWIYRRWRIS